MAMWARDRLYLAVLHGGRPTDDEWTRWVELGVLRNGRDQRVLVEARGGGPTPKQRRAILAANKADARIAIMTESTFVRGIVTAFSWFDITLHAFPLTGHQLAVKFLELSPEEIETAFEVLPRIRAEAGVEQP
jgi:hypothetical protein